jgi:hypothetical protein
MSATLVEHRPFGLDVPENAPYGIDLGRINNLDEAIRRFGLEFVTKLTDYAMIGDEPGYRAYLAFRDKDQNASWRTFEKALEHGLDALDDPAPALVDLFNEMESVPDWVDFDQIRRGAVAYWRSGPFTPMAIAYGAIGAGFSMYSSTRPVLFSGRLNHPVEVGPRMSESFRWVVAAHTPGAMERQGDGFKLTARVRMIHAAVRQTLSFSENWDWPGWGVPINGLDMMNTQAGQFGVIVVDALRGSGVRVTDREEEDIFALTRYIGWVMGVPPEVLHVGVDDGRMKAKLHALIEQPPDDDCKIVVRSIIDFSTEKPPGDVEILPGPVAKFMTTERRRRLAYGLIRGWVPRYADSLSIEKTPWRFTVPVTRPLVSAYEHVRPYLPHDDEKTTMRTIEQFNRAIALPRDADQSEALASPEKLLPDIAANKGAVKKLTANASGT